MFENVEETVETSNLVFRSGGEVWTYFEDHPHIRRFTYEIVDVPDDDDEQPRTVGSAEGYRIVHDWTVTSDDALRDEADALDGDILAYVEALIRELAACEAVLAVGGSLAMVQHVTVLRHVEAVEGVNAGRLLHAAAAFLAMLDAPGLMLVDPWPEGEARSRARQRLEGRSHVPKLLELGFVRMVGSRFLWAWSRELAESLLEGYSYEALVAAKRAGKLAGVFGAMEGLEAEDPLQE